MRAERSHPDELGGAPLRPRSARAGSDRPARDRGAAGDDWSYDRSESRGGRPERQAPTGRERRSPSRSAAPQRGIRGALGVLAVFLVTLAGAAADSYLGVGLGTITMVALIGSVVVASLLVRRRDLVTVVVAPPLVYVAVALVNIALAPSATFNIATLATLLIRGFPAMAIAVAAAAVLSVVRAIARR